MTKPRSGTPPPRKGEEAQRPESAQGGAGLTNETSLEEMDAKLERILKAVTAGCEPEPEPEG